MTRTSGKLLGNDQFRECLERAMTWYGVDRAGFDQKDLLPMAAVLAAQITGVTKRPGEKKPRICINGMEKDKNRKMAKKYLMRRIRVHPEECMVDLYCYSGQSDPFLPILTMECEGHAGHSKDVTPRASSETCDYLWDLFKLIQVPSPLRIFLAICTEKKRSLLEKQVGAMVRNYGDILKRDCGEVFAVIFPETKLTGKTIMVQGWTYPKGKKETRWIPDK
ncbi:MAG: hypothetical protein E4H32_07550 [Nitrospirales bacterium]|nr:MAG: hypothetical protein E4H32_07550 [Nitrospirales bacterium]